jgi:glycosyltransferase involved in cell wall biosynthesis
MERQFVRRADHVLTVSDDDRLTFLRFVPDRQVTTVPTGVDLDYFRLRDTSEKAHTLVFTGSMDWAANEDAILYFCSEILPRIRRQIPDARLSVVGRNPTRRIRALKAEDALVDVTGTVDDIRRYVHEAAVYVVPLRIGGGTRIKIFEAMALAKPVVSTTLGAQGLPVRHGENVLLADTPETFAEHTVRLLRDCSERQRLGRAGRSLVESRYSWPAAVDVVEGVLSALQTKGEANPRINNILCRSSRSRTCEV